MVRHFGALIPSTNTTVEIECRLLPATCQAHVGRLLSSGRGSFSPRGFGATDAYAIEQLGSQNAREAFARIYRPEIEVFVVPGGNFPTTPSIAAWEREFGKPVVTTNQASFWAVLRAFDSAVRRRLSADDQDDRAPGVSAEERPCRSRRHQP